MDGGWKEKEALAGILIANAVLLSVLDLGRAVDVLQIRTRCRLTYRLFASAFLTEGKIAASRQRRSPVKEGGGGVRVRRGGRGLSRLAVSAALVLILKLGMLRYSFIFY